MHNFKVGDTISIPRKRRDDYRREKYIPTFIIEEISEQNGTYWLRPEKGESSGIEIKQCKEIISEYQIY